MCNVPIVHGVCQSNLFIPRLHASCQRGTSADRSCLTLAWIRTFANKTMGKTRHRHEEDAVKQRLIHSGVQHEVDQANLFSSGGLMLSCMNCLIVEH